MRAFLAVMACGLAAVATAEEKKGVVREIKTDKIKGDLGARGDAAKPTKITSAEELAMAVADKDAAAAIGKEVDFAKEYLLLFRWAGSGGDELTAAGDEKKATFALKRGLTKDLRTHVHLYAVAKDAEWGFAK